MSKDNVKNFFTEIEKNPELKEKYISAMKDYHQEAEKIMADKLLSLGKNSGFVFTEKDLHEARAEFMDKLNENTELDDGELTEAAGGRGDMFDKKTKAVIASLTLFGLGCAIQSIYQEVQGPGRCGAHLSTTAKC